VDRRHISLRTPARREEAGPVDVLRGYTYGSKSVWSSELGSPIASSKQFEWLYAYAPLVHIRPYTAYAATLVMTSENDARVSPAHAYKFAAKLQRAQKSNAPILLYVARDAGHVAGSLTSQSDTLADTAAFLWWQTVQPKVTCPSRRRCTESI
jgi:prolyl oligopeptidase